jgi:hypothetical protein
MPRSAAARAIRMPISPRLAMSNALKVNVVSPSYGLAHDFLFVA